MNLGVIGVSQAGGKINEARTEYGYQIDGDYISAAIGINTAKADLLDLDRIHMDDRLLIGQNRIKGHGAGADNELGATIAKDDLSTVMNTVAELPIADIDAFLVGRASRVGRGAEASRSSPARSTASTRSPSTGSASCRAVTRAGSINSTRRGRF